MDRSAWDVEGDVTAIASLCDRPEGRGLRDRDLRSFRSTVGGELSAPWMARPASHSTQRAEPHLDTERLKPSKVQHQVRQTPASGDTNLRKQSQVAGVGTVTVAPSG